MLPENNTITCMVSKFEIELIDHDMFEELLREPKTRYIYSVFEPDTYIIYYGYYRDDDSVAFAGWTEEKLLGIEPIRAHKFGIDASLHSTYTINLIKEALFENPWINSVDLYLTSEEIFNAISIIIKQACWHRHVLRSQYQVTDSPEGK